MTFKSLGLSDLIIKKLIELDYKIPYPIQQKAIPAILQGKDILGIAPTGSGKTASYVLPILMNLKNNNESKNRHVNVLVLVPTRELSIQINEVFQQFILEDDRSLKSLAVYGGVSINPQMIALQNVTILIATPGRLLDLVDSNAVHLSIIQTLVLDEADKMLNLGFKEELKRLFKLLPPNRQNLLFSATLSENLNTIQKEFLKSPELIKIEAEVNQTELINQLAYSVTEERKGPLLRYLIKTKNLTQVLIFTSSIKKADNVANKLRNNGIEAWPIHSKKTQGVRNDLLTKFKHGKLRVLVTTDLLTRGIDIDFLPHVINYELPRSPKDYIHRIGRTGRADSPGEAISFIAPAEEHHFKVIQKKIGKKIEVIDSENYDLKGY